MEYLYRGTEEHPQQPSLPRSNATPCQPMVPKGAQRNTPSNHHSRAPTPHHASQWCRKANRRIENPCAATPPHEQKCAPPWKTRNSRGDLKLTNGAQRNTPSNHHSRAPTPHRASQWCRKANRRIENPCAATPPHEQKCAPPWKTRNSRGDLKLTNGAQRNTPSNHHSRAPTPHRASQWCRKANRRIENPCAATPPHEQKCAPPWKTRNSRGDLKLTNGAQRNTPSNHHSRAPTPHRASQWCRKANRRIENPCAATPPHEQKCAPPWKTRNSRGDLKLTNGGVYNIHHSHKPTGR
ncbi:uncharacterized protein LOC129347500 [Amphiprion ocellaris]|uniref:uncharacterized protein LOC129347500 n=1 Tax=Amphiprion ocellaris TaxID=80972 RepID=UPI00241153A9|nr:uncharacterized protein LOC129347500 [Amphiprion ocellaris]